MSREKQIEEMRKKIHAEISKAVESGLITWTDFADWLTESLYNADYRKQSEVVKEVLEKAASKFAGHSDYHGDTILQVLYCMAEGKEVDNAKPLDAKQSGPFSRPHENDSEWISVEERLPEITETVLIAYKEKWEWETEWTFDVDVGSLDITGREWNTYHDLYEGQELHITHWMPLPEAPKEGGE